MPSYCYTDDHGETVERRFALGHAPDAIELDGHRRAVRDIAAEHRGFRNTPGNWPLKSDACGVAPSQVREATEHAAAHGVPTEFTEDGRAILRSPEHRRRYCRARGLYDRNAGYSDPAPIHS